MAARVGGSQPHFRGRFLRGNLPGPDAVDETRSFGGRDEDRNGPVAVDDFDVVIPDLGVVEVVEMQRSDIIEEGI